MNIQTKKLHWLVLVIGVFVFGGCTVAKISGRGPVPLILNQPQARVEVIKEVRESKRIVFDYTAAFDASEILSKHFAEYKADAIINLVIIVKTTPADFFINFFTLGIARSKTFEISGQLVKAPGGLGSISIPGSQKLAESKNLNDIVSVALQDSRDDASVNMIVHVEERGEDSYRLIRYALETDNRYIILLKN